MLDKLASIRKALVAGIGGLLTALTFTQNFDWILPGSTSTTVGVVITVLTTVLTWLVPNAKT